MTSHFVSWSAASAQTATAAKLSHCAGSRSETFLGHRDRRQAIGRRADPDLGQFSRAARSTALLASLAVDTEARPGQSLEPLGRDLRAARGTESEAAVLDPLQSPLDLLQAFLR